MHPLMSPSAPRSQAVRRRRPRRGKFQYMPVCHQYLIYLFQEPSRLSALSMKLDSFLSGHGRRFSSITDDPRELFHLFQCISGFIKLHCIALYAWHCIALHCFTVCYVQYITHNTLHCIVLQCIALNYNTLHCITIHYITSHHVTSRHTTPHQM